MYSSSSNRAILSLSSLLFIILIHLPSTSTKWTIFVYMNADNNLEQFSQLNIEQMAKISNSPDKFTFILRIDRNGYYWNGTFLDVPYFTGGKDFLIGDNKATEINDLGEINMDDPAVLEEFVSWGIKTYPADHYGLVLWDHGSGYIGYGDDETPKRTLSLPSLYTAISTALNGEVLDFFGFDACLMADYESIYYASSIAKYYIASLELEPGHGWDWTAFDVLSTTDDVETIGRSLVDKFLTYSANENSTSVTLGLFDMAQFSEVETDLKAWASNLVKTLNHTSIGVNTTVCLFRAIANSYSPGSSPGDYAASLKLFDLVAVLNRFLHCHNLDSSLVDITNTTLTSVKKLITYYGHDTSCEGTYGISMFLPFTGNATEILDSWIDYTDKSSFEWLYNFLYSFLTDQPPGLGTISSTIVKNVVKDETLWTVTGEANPIDYVVKAELFWGNKDSNKIFFWGSTAATIIDSLMVAEMPNNLLPAFCPSSNSSLDECYFPFSQFEKSGNVSVLTLFFSYLPVQYDYEEELIGMAYASYDTDGKFLGELFFSFTGSSFSEIVWEEGDRIYPLTYGNLYGEFEYYTYGNNSYIEIDSSLTLNHRDVLISDIVCTVDLVFSVMSVTGQTFSSQPYNINFTECSKIITTPDNTTQPITPPPHVNTPTSSDVFTPTSSDVFTPTSSDVFTPTPTPTPTRGYPLPPNNPPFTSSATRYSVLVGMFVLGLVLL
eukprot:TRINITY_DN465_c0_g1_i1.p1 TRINITY_DN465_c0_g1~~TRINITY_DN465_c0_g1_i1.p1  ORF type:complete len:721 (-),score=169.45 TRINITY_DN465_c0_g1_i1:62-2224(-)